MLPSSIIWSLSRVVFLKFSVEKCVKGWSHRGGGGEIDINQWSGSTNKGRTCLQYFSVNVDLIIKEKYLRKKCVH